MSYSQLANQGGGKAHALGGEGTLISFLVWHSNTVSSGMPGTIKSFKFWSLMVISTKCSFFAKPSQSNPVSSRTSLMAHTRSSSSLLIFPRGKLQLAPFFQPFTSKHLSMARFRIMAPRTGTRVLYAMKLRNALSAPLGGSPAISGSGHTAKIFERKERRFKVGKLGLISRIKSSKYHCAASIWNDSRCEKRQTQQSDVGTGEKKQTSIDCNSSSGRLRMNLRKTRQHNREAGEGGWGWGFVGGAPT